MVFIDQEKAYDRGSRDIIGSSKDKGGPMVFVEIIQDICDEAKTSVGKLRIVQ